MIRNIVFTWIMIGCLMFFVKLTADYTESISKKQNEIEVLKVALQQEMLKNAPEESVSHKYSFINPIHKDDFIAYTSPFGLRNVPAGIYTGGSPTREHNALDLIGTWHARIVAAASGIVKEKWYVPDGKRRTGHPIYGGYIVIEHPDGSQTEYAHCSAIYVKQGDIVEQGQVIGRQGDTGMADGEHVHFGIIINGEHVNPLKYIK